MDQALIVTGWLLGVGSLALLVWALWWDRARGRVRCGRCWYDLSGVVGLEVGQGAEEGEEGVREKRPTESRPHGGVVCPECGRTPRSWKALRRTRRRWRWAFVAVVIGVAGVVVGLTPAYRGGRLLNRVPAWALAEMVPLFPSINATPPATSLDMNHAGWELIRRLVTVVPPDTTSRSVVGDREISNEAMAAVIRRMAEGNWYAPAGSRRWAETSGEWLTGQMFRFRKGGPQGALTYPDGSPADAALTDAFAQLDRVMPRWYPQTRAAWPVGTAVTIEDGAAHPRWLSYYNGPYPDAAWSVRGTDLSGTGMRLPAVGVPGDEVVADLTLRWYRLHPREREKGTEPIREEDFVVRWRVSERLEDVVELVDSEEIRRAMVEVFARETAWDFDRFIDGPVWLGEGMDGVGFGVRNEVFVGDESLGSWYFWWLAEDGKWVQRTQGNGMFVDFDGFAERVKAAMDAGTLRVRISGVPEEALTLLDAKKIWVGNVEVILSGAMEATEISAPAGED